MTVDSGIRHDESFYVIANSSNCTVYFKDIDYYSGKRCHKNVLMKTRGRKLSNDGITCVVLSEDAKELPQPMQNKPTSITLAMADAPGKRRCVVRLRRLRLMNPALI